MVQSRKLKCSCLSINIAGGFDKCFFVLHHFVTVGEKKCIQCSTQLKHSKSVKYVKGMHGNVYKTVLSSRGMYCIYLCDIYD